MSTAPTIGVEEEYLLVDPDTRTPQAGGPRVVARAATDLGDSVSGEFTQYQIEVKTPPCGGAGQLRAELLRLRASVATAACAEGLRLCASGTPVLGAAGFAPVGDHPRYRAGVAQYRGMLDDFAVCSMHIHVHLPDRELAVRVSNHLRPWLPLLVAMSANSPFHQGLDTGYASWRAVIRTRFPCLGPPPYAASLRHHEELAAAIAESGAMLDAQTPFWDIRPNPHVPTLEVRAMDVTADIDDAIALAVLLRALVTTAAAKASEGDPGPQSSSEVLRAAYWRAARDGWAGCGVDALTGQVLPAPLQAARLVDYVGAHLEDHGDMQTVAEFLRRISSHGTGAERQRRSAELHGSLTGVVDDLVALTARR
ncbi:carboxylate-amine ligase [Mycobacterium sp. MMS18-G62]